MNSTDAGPSHPIPPSRLAELLLANAKDYAVLTMDRDGLVTSWSPGAVRIFGYSAEEILGAPFARLFTASDVAAGHDRQELETALRDGRAEDTRWQLRKGGQRFWANGVTFALQESDFDGLLKIVRDETAARIAEEQRSCSRTSSVTASTTPSPPSSPWWIRPFAPGT